MIRFLALAAALAVCAPAHAHDIYTGVKGKDGHICCGHDDCSVTTYREIAGDYEFLTREGHWVRIPEDRITFLPIAGDKPNGDSHMAHLCYGVPMGYESGADGYFTSRDQAQTIILFCAFIPPNGA